jgi:hypothetical protein
MMHFIAFGAGFYDDTGRRLFFAFWTRYGGSKRDW